MLNLGSHSYSAPSVVATLSRFDRERQRGLEGLEGVSRPFVEEFRRPLDGGALQSECRVPWSFDWGSLGNCGGPLLAGNFRNYAPPDCEGI
jgi:hypothetical protein